MFWYLDTYQSLNVIEDRAGSKGGVRGVQITLLWTPTRALPWTAPPDPLWKGFTFRETLYKFIGMDPGQHLITGPVDKPIGIIRKATRASSKVFKQKRKGLKYAKHSSKEAKKKKIESEFYKAAYFDWFLSLEALKLWKERESLFFVECGDVKFLILFFHGEKLWDKNMKWEWWLFYLRKE